MQNAEIFTHPTVHMSTCLIQYHAVSNYLILSVPYILTISPRVSITIKGTVLRNFRPFYKKTPPEPHMNRQKRIREMFRCREDIREKTCVRVVNDKRDTVSA